MYGTSIVETVPVSDTKTAEAVKLTENIFRSVNIALVNELKVVFHKMDIDVHEVLDAAATKPFGFMKFTPGPGLGRSEEHTSELQSRGRLVCRLLLEK